MYANMFNKSKELVFYVVSVFGYEELENATDDMVEKLFLDAWGSSVAEAAYYGLRQSIAMSLEEKGIYSTAAFSPGQHDVPMEIQKVIFGELQPEEIGVTLNDHFLMHPKRVYPVHLASEEKKMNVICDLVIFAYKRNMFRLVYRDFL